MRQQTRTASQELGDLNQDSLSSGSPLLSVLQVTVPMFRLNQMISSLDTESAYSRNDLYLSRGFNCSMNQNQDPYGINRKPLGNSLNLE